MDLDYTLHRLAELLDSHGGDAAAWLRTVHDRLAQDETGFYAALNSKRMWGGAGSIANEALADNPGMRPAHWDMDIREFRALMIDLAEHLKARGPHYPDIDFWLAAFTNWQQSNV
jgi:hypothetical protein